MQKHTTEHIIDLREECWQPLIYYRASLLAVAEGEDAVSYVSSDRKLHLSNRSPFSKQKLEGAMINNKRKHRFFMSLLSPSTSCTMCVSFLTFQEASLPARSAPLTPKSVKFTGPASVRGEAQKYFLTFRFDRRHTANLCLAHMNYCNIISHLSHREKTSDMVPLFVAMETPVKRSNMEASVLSAGNEADEDTVDIEL